MTEKKNKSIFDLAEFKPYLTAWNNRQSILSKRASYYDGSVYDKSVNALGWLGPRIAQNIEPLYLPLGSAVDVDAGIIPSGWKLPEDDPKSEQWQKAIDTVFDWSNWDTDGVLYIHYGAQYGVSGLRVADLREQKRVIVQPTDPMLFMTIGMKAYDNTPDMGMLIEKRQDADGKDFEYAEVVTPELISTFKNGDPMGFDGRDPEYTNELKFVPYVEVRHIETGKPFGECTFQKAIRLLDSVNNMASSLKTIIDKNTKPQWFLTGVEPGELNHSDDNAWFGPEGAKAQILIPDIDIEGVLGFIDKIAANVEKALPEKAFDELRRKDQIATATLELQLMELVLKIKRARPNYDKGLKIALQMAGRAAASIGGMADIAVLNDEELRFDDQRAILPVDEKGQIDLEMARLELAQMQNATINEGNNAQ
jgi:hypothetical protein